MDTNRAKNVVIVILLILNAILFYFIWQEESAFTVSRSQYSAIHSLLQRNGIALHAAIEGSDFSPRQVLRMEIFPDDVMESLLYGRGRVYHRAGIFEFRADTEPWAQRTPLTEQSAIDISLAFLADFEAAGGVAWGFELVGISGSSTEVLLQFMGHSDGLPIASNLVLFRIDETGIVSIDSQLARPMGFSGVAHKIYSVDAALLTLMHGLTSRFPNREIRIDSYSLVYIFEADLADGISDAWPAYMFTVTIPGLQEERLTIFVDAYNNSDVTHRVTREQRFRLMNRP